MSQHITVLSSCRNYTDNSTKKRSSVNKHKQLNKQATQKQQDAALVAASSHGKLQHFLQPIEKQKSYTNKH